MLEKHNQFHGNKGISSRQHTVSQDNNLVDKLIHDIQASRLSVCSERAMLLTEFNKRYEKQFSSINLRQAHALRYILENKKTLIYPNERLIGNFT